MMMVMNLLRSENDDDVDDVDDDFYCSGDDCILGLVREDCHFLGHFYFFRGFRRCS